MWARSMPCRTTSAVTESTRKGMSSVTSRTTARRHPRRRAGGARRRWPSRAGAPRPASGDRSRARRAPRDRGRGPRRRARSSSSAAGGRAGRRPSSRRGTAAFFRPVRRPPPRRRGRAVDASRRGRPRARRARSESRPTEAPSGPRAGIAGATVVLAMSGHATANRVGRHGDAAGVTDPCPAAVSAVQDLVGDPAGDGEDEPTEDGGDEAVDGEPVGQQRRSGRAARR